LIDPRTGLPSASGIHSVSVVSPTAVQAEVAAKALVIGGIENQAAKELFIRAVVVWDDGRIVTVPGTVGGHVDVIDLTAHAAIAV
jgi:thiamine biosynthesis lipoprotein ApbE